MTPPGAPPLALHQPGLRQSMAWIHGWLGLIAGWLLFAMFLTGTASYFRPEITRWMQPELRLPAVSPQAAAASAFAYLQRTAPDARQWYIYLPTERTPATRLFIQPRPAADPKAAPRKPRRSEIDLDPATGRELVARDTRGGEQFYRFHFQFQLPHPWGRWLAGLCAIAMLSAIVSGVITHKRIFADFFTLRWKKGQRSWLDAHNAAAVLALPYHAMITYTGLITLVFMYMPWPVMANYAQPAAFGAEAYGFAQDKEPAGRAAPLAPVAPLVADASRAWGGEPAGTVIVRNPNDAASTVTLGRSGTSALGTRSGAITYSGTDGRRLSASPPPGPAIETASVMLGLHIAWFAGPLLRWIYFLLGLTGVAMVGSGLVLWSVKHRKPGAAPFFGLALVDRLNVGVIACLPAGMAAYLLANRLLPPALAGRADMEVSAMFWVWFGLAALSCLRPLRRAWIETLGLAAALFAAIPVVNALTTDRGLIASLLSGDILFAAFDGMMMLVAALLAFAARKAAAPPHAVRRGRRPASATPLHRAADAA